MILVDANLLIYAYDSRSPLHREAREWLETALSGVNPVCLAWQSILAFLRITTDPRIFERPFRTVEAVEIVQTWFEQAAVRLLQPSERHWTILRRLLPDSQARGPLIMDGHLAALAIEHGAVLHTTDLDFARFSGVRTVNPIADRS